MRKGKEIRPIFYNTRRILKGVITFSGISKLPSTLNHTHYHLRWGFIGSVCTNEEAEDRPLPKILIKRQMVKPGPWILWVQIQ